VLDGNYHVAGILTTDDIGYNLKSMSEELAARYLNLAKRE